MQTSPDLAAGRTPRNPVGRRRLRHPL